jgi:hypothetical protein
MSDNLSHSTGKITCETSRLAAFSSQNLAENGNFAL